MHFKHIRKIMIMNYTKNLKIWCLAIVFLQKDNGNIWNLCICVHYYIINPPLSLNQSGYNENRRQAVKHTSLFFYEA